MGTGTRPLERWTVVGKNSGSNPVGIHLHPAVAKR